VRLLALALVVAQIVSCGECVFDSDFVHEIQLASAGFIVHFEAWGVMKKAGVAPFISEMSHSSQKQA
jgi:hypothetical protein